MRRVSIAAVLLFAACRAEPGSGPPARLVVGLADTLVVNRSQPARIPVRILDGAGRALADTGVRFAWVSGDPIAVSSSGHVACTRRGDATVGATLAGIATQFILRCRPVQALRFGGPVQLVLGDSAQPIPVTAYGPDNRTVDLIAGSVRVGDSSLVALQGLRVRPRRWGASIVTVAVGDVQATTGLHVYAPAVTLAGLEREPRLVAVPLRLAPGEQRRWELPWGSWMLSMWPEEDALGGLQLRIEGAGCRPTEQISRRRYLCSVTGRASVVVYAPWSAGATQMLQGTLAIKPSGETRRTRRASLASVAPDP